MLFRTFICQSILSAQCDTEGHAREMNDIRIKNVHMYTGHFVCRLAATDTTSVDAYAKREDGRGGSQCRALLDVSRPMAMDGCWTTRVARCSLASHQDSYDRLFSLAYLSHCCSRAFRAAYRSDRSSAGMIGTRPCRSDWNNLQRRWQEDEAEHECHRSRTSCYVVERAKDQ